MAENCVLERETAVRMFVALGFKAAPRWPDERLVRKLAAVPAIVEDDLLPDDEDAAATLVEVLDAAEKGKTFVLSDGEAETPDEKKLPDESETTATPENTDASKPEKKKSAKRSGKEPKRKAAAGKDDFGLRIGSKGSALCACLTDTPKTMKQLMREAGQTTAFYGTLQKLVAAGKVVRTAGGFRRA